MKQHIATITLFVMLANANAGEIFPTGCTPILVHEELVKLSTTNPSVVMIHNLSSKDLWITHPVSEPSASAGWSSRLQGGNWSALALSAKEFDLSCIESRPGHEQQVPCAGLLAACKWSKATMPEKKTGTFWAAEDMTLTALKAHLGSDGFVLSAPSKPE
jgi:hypothetical protein